MNEIKKGDKLKSVEIVSGAIIRKDNKILVVRQSKWNNKWTFPCGHIEIGESILESAKREGEEETGLKLAPVKIICFGELINSKDFCRPAHFIYFDCVLDVIAGELKLQEDELSEAKWLTPQEALELDLAESYKESIKEYIEFLCIKN